MLERDGVERHGAGLDRSERGRSELDRAKRERRGSRRFADWPFARRIDARSLLLIALVVAVLGSALAIISTSHLTRVQYARLQSLENQRDALQTEWGRLLLEESTWSSPARVESLATERLEMHVPSVSDVKVIQP